MEYYLNNGIISVTIDSHGAEICSVKNNKGNEYIWSADSTYWGRHAPVLFPVVGKFKDCVYRYHNQKYSMGQHGFARDMDFVCKGQDDKEIWFELCNNEKTMQVYPFAFSLKIGYRIYDNCIEVLWQVRNEDEMEKMYFSIGAHPAFVCPWAESLEAPYRLMFPKKKELSYRFLNADGLLLDKTYKLLLENECVLLQDHFFDESAYVFEDSQLSEVALVTPEGNPYVTLSFDSPVVGIWSPERKHAPFVCIEPWFGRCDRSDFSGSLEEREWSNVLAPQEVFQHSYKIMFS